MRPLHWKRRWRVESPEDDLVIDDKMRFEPCTLMDTSREDKRIEAETSEDPDSDMVCASDDPRRGGKTKCIISKETKAGSSGQTAKDDTSRSRKVSPNVHAMNQLMRSKKPDMAGINKIIDPCYSSTTLDHKDNIQPKDAFNLSNIL